MIKALLLIGSDVGTLPGLVSEDIILYLVVEKYMIGEKLGIFVNYGVCLDNMSSGPLR